MTHTYNPHPKYPWFCKDCGYAEHERLQHSVSDVHSQSEDAQAAECEACQRGGEAETPFPTSPLNEGAWTGEIGLTWPEINARDRTIAAAAFESGKREAESQITTLLTNLAKAQRERAIYEDRWQSEFKSRLTAEARAEAAEAQLAEAQRERDEARDRLKLEHNLNRERIEAAESRLSHLQTRLEEMGRTLNQASAVLRKVSDGKLVNSFEVQDAINAISQTRAALQPKGESRE